MLFRIPGRSPELSTAYLPEEIIITSWEKSHLPVNETGSSKLGILPEETPRQAYEEAFEVYQRTFEKTKLNKAILSAVIRQKKPKGFEPVNFFFKLCEHYPNAFTYLLFHPEAGLWCGATPEILISGESATFQTVSLAGTQPKSQGSEYNWKDKEIEEQELVSKHIRHILQEAQTSNILESPTETVEAGEVAHLKTVFSFSYTDSVDILLDRLHPTPAIAGFPVKDSVELIQRTETHHRGLYTGYLGIKTKLETRIYVNLRCMQMGTEDIALYVGGGITAKSDLNAEWTETRLKAKTLLNLLKTTD
ncbi:MAG: chorismate-binding protein [Flavobacteriales bacterium]|nr:chorismate-binding protein [Flavobacteriales bacterium]